MTDNEIIKAYQWCVQFLINLAVCNNGKKKYAIAFENVSVIKRILRDYDRQQEEKKAMLAHIDCLQAENERLNEEICIQHKIIDERGAEVLRHDRCIRTLHEKLETAKAEAIKGCVFKIKDQIKNNSTISAEWLREYLDKILEEMERESGCIDN